MNPADRTHAHSKLVLAVREALVRTERLILWPNPTGYDGRARRDYGLGKGGADIVGIIAGIGRFFAVECKTGGADLEPDQVCWHRAVKKIGGFACVARSVDDALAALERASVLIQPTRPLFTIPGAIDRHRCEVVWRFFE